MGHRVEDISRATFADQQRHYEAMHVRTVLFPAAVQGIVLQSGATYGFDQTMMNTCMVSILNSPHNQFKTHQEALINTARFTIKKEFQPTIGSSGYVRKQRFPAIYTLVDATISAAEHSSLITNIHRLDHLSKLLRNETYNWLSPYIQSVAILFSPEDNEQQVQQMLEKHKLEIEKYQAKKRRQART